MNEAEPREITKHYELSATNWNGFTLDEVVEQIQHLKNEGWETWNVEPYEYYAEIQLSCKCMETEEEVASRLRREQSHKENRRRKYEELKKEFDPEN